MENNCLIRNAHYLSQEYAALCVCVCVRVCVYVCFGIISSDIFKRKVLLLKKNIDGDRQTESARLMDGRTE